MFVCVGGGRENEDRRAEGGGSVEQSGECGSDGAMDLMRMMEEETFCESGYFRINEN